jgi:RNA recognition motif-containing protein
LAEYLKQYTSHIYKISLPDKTPRSKYAFLTFDTKEHMEEFKSIGVIYKDNRQLLIKNYTSRDSKNTQNQKPRLFVHNLPEFWSDDDLKNLFENYGKTNSAYIIFDRDTGKSRGFGYVEMNNA